MGGLIRFLVVQVDHVDLLFFQVGYQITCEGKRRNSVPVLK